MKKITLVVFIALLSIKCSKDDASVSEDNNIIIQVNPLKNLNNGLVSYPLINSDSEQKGEIVINHDDTSIYLECHLQPNIKIKKAALYLGKYEKIPHSKQVYHQQSFNQFHEFETSISSSLFTFSQAVLPFDENGCIYIAPYFEIEDTEHNRTELIFITNQLLPGNPKQHYFLYCVK